jgi:hypothetical protein
MFELLADPVWGGIGTIVSIAAIVSPWLFRKKKKAKSIPDEEAPNHKPSEQSEVYGLVQRFVQIYKSHGIERTQIPRFLGEDGGLALADIGTDVRLLEALSEKILKDTCFRFGVSREWLDGKDVPVWPCLYYDKNLKGFIDFLESLNAEFDYVEGFAIKCEKDKLKKDDDNFPVALVFRGKIDHWGGTGEESIWKYYPMNDTLFWSYDRTRIQIKAMALTAWQFNIHMGGCELPQKQVEALIEGEIFPGPLLDHLSRVAWHPDDYIFANGESVCAKDVTDAQKMYDEMERLGWLNYLIEKTGPVPRPIAGRRELSS